MKKLKTVLSSATLLSVGGVGLLSYERIVEPAKEEVATYVGLDQVEYSTMQDASNSFIIEQTKRYVVDGIEFADYKEYEKYHLDKIEEVDVYNINNEMYLSKTEIYSKNNIENYFLYENDYYLKSEIDNIIKEKAEEFILAETFHIFRMPTRTEYFSMDPGEGGDYVPPPVDDSEVVYIVSVDIEFDQTRLDLTDLWGYNIIIPSGYIDEIEELRTGITGTCKSDSISIQFSRAVDCSDIFYNGSKTVYTDILTNEESLVKSDVFNKRVNSLWSTIQYRYKFMNNYYLSTMKIDEYIESRKEKRYIWNDIYYSNKSIISNNIYIHFKEIEQDVIIEESIMCNGDIILKDSSESYALNNYEMLVNQCVYGNISM